MLELVCVVYPIEESGNWVGVRLKLDEICEGVQPYVRFASWREGLVRLCDLGCYDRPLPRSNDSWSDS